jgi:hypothetical protein
MKILMLFHDFDVIDLLFHDFDVLDLLFHDFDVINRMSVCMDLILVFQVPYHMYSHHLVSSCLVRKMTSRLWFNADQFISNNGNNITSKKIINIRKCLQKKVKTCHCLVFLTVFCMPLFVLCPFSFGKYCLPFVYFRILNTPLVSSRFS